MFRQLGSSTVLALGLLCGGVTCGLARPLDDAVVAQFFGIWDSDAAVTLSAVEGLYAHSVLYYGETLSARGVYDNKRRFILRWPQRRYALVPGTVSKGCDDAGQARCRISAVLAWRTANPARDARAGGWTRVTLDLVRENGDLKIARESGRPVARPD